MAPDSCKQALKHCPLMLSRSETYGADRIGARPINSKLTVAIAQMPEVDPGAMRAIAASWRFDVSRFRIFHASLSAHTLVAAD